VEGYPNLRKISNLIKEDEENKLRATHTSCFPMTHNSPSHLSQNFDQTFSSPILFSTGKMG
jgi:hypothetical protein